MRKESSMLAGVRRIAVIGSGIAGLTLGQRLKQADFQVTLFDKARGPGGRMASKRLEQGSLDLGAQYFTVRDPRFRRFLADHASGCLGEWTGTLRYQRPDGTLSPYHADTRYVGVPRMSAITRALSDGLALNTGTRITRISQTPDQGWQLEDEAGASWGDYDRLILCQPPVQARDLLAASDLDDEADVLADHLDALTPCWAVAAHFSTPLSLDYDGIQFQQGPLQWAANNSSKPGRKDAGQWWVLHGSSEWSDSHREATGAEVEAALLAAFREQTGETVQPDQVLSHRWLFARAEVSAAPGHLILAGGELAVCGDWLHGGRVEGAFLSAESLLTAWGLSG
ncbi:NAD(P)/FAD-dependent oxidoreductase [Marinobacter sp. CA1]|uniref:NAD(P)/FAD-dependent oxidoreductase n=1 Tax=Marinobacter sp. CA1 TaxID=2817656 RepID=UPI001D069F58|nr:NAD(P)-binding protein [Marinobacter sp. CA1]UDL07130.1 NAD(P)-binding protein [Marinobacter sp. CA1]